MKRKVHVLMCAEWLYNFAGTELYTVTYLKLVKDAGFQITLAIACSVIRKEYMELLARLNVKYYLYNEKSVLQLTSKSDWLMHIYETNNCSIIHFIPTEKLAFEFLALPKKTPILVTETTDASSNVWWLDENYSNLVKNADMVIAMSEHARENLKVLHNIYNVIVIPPTILQLFPENNDLDVSYPKTDLLYIGRLSEEKGIEFLLGALSQVFRVRGKTSLAIYGSGPDLDRLKAITTLLELDELVSFFGEFPPNHKKFVYKSSVLVVLPSLTEGLPFCLLEAMYYEVPFIATSVGGISELLGSYKDHLVEPGSSDKLAEKIHYYLGHSNKQSLRNVVKSCYNMKWSAHHVIKDIVKIYRRYDKFS